MRILLALVLLALGGWIIWHGIDSEPAARTELDAQRSKTKPDFTKLHVDYPYTFAAIDANQITLDNEINKKSGVVTTPGKEELWADVKTVTYEIPEKTKDAISTDKPFVRPYAAAIIGIAGLLLAVILPGTRLRGLAFLGLLFGAACALAGMLPLDHQVGLVNKFSALKHVIYNFPRVAQACVALAAITLAVRFRARPAPAS